MGHRLGSAIPTIPAFESQQAYLKRHGLLLPAECRQIPEPVRYLLRIEAATRWK